MPLLTDHGRLSPLSANLHALQKAFYDADVKPDPNSEVNAILAHDDKGDLGLYNNLQMRYILSNGLVYRTGHGRHKCSYNECVIDADANDDDDDDVVSHNWTKFYKFNLHTLQESPNLLTGFPAQREVIFTPVL